MAKNFIVEGDKITVTLAGTKAAGDIVVQGKLVGIAESAGGSGDTITVAREGVFRVAKATPLAITQGDFLYYDSVNNEVNKTVAGNTYVGKAFTSAGSSDTTVELLLDAVNPDSTNPADYQLTSEKMVVGGYPGLRPSTGDLGLLNSTGVVSYINNTNTSSRTYVMPDTSGQVAVGSANATVTFTAGVGAVTFGTGDAARVKAGSLVMLQEITALNASSALGVAYPVGNVASTSCTITMKKDDTTTETGDASTRNVLVLF